MTMVRWLAIASASLFAVASAASAQETTPIPEGAFSAFESEIQTPAEPGFSDAQRAELHAIIQQYIQDNPQVILQALQAYQQRQQQQAHQQRTQAQTTAAVGDNVVDPENDPIAGDPDGSVTVVEFFDYHCPFCKRISRGMAKLAEDDDVRIVFKEFPVFGPDSVFAARAALASKKQGLYHDFHIALMQNRGPLNERIVMRLADRVGLDVDRLRDDMNAPEVEQTLRTNFQLAQQLGIRGTPSFIIGDEVIPGAVDLTTMRRLIQAKRQS